MSRRTSVPRPPAAVADRIHSAAIHLLRSLRKQDTASGVTAARLSALSVVVFGGPITIGQLASAEQVSAPTMTRIVVGMERDGLVARASDKQDRRVVWIRTTPKGSRILGDARRLRIAALARELAALEPGELELLDQAAGIIEKVARPGA